MTYRLAPPSNVPEGPQRDAYIALLEELGINPNDLETPAKFQRVAGNVLTKADEPAPPSGLKRLPQKRRDLGVTIPIQPVIDDARIAVKKVFLGVVERAAAQYAKKKSTAVFRKDLPASQIAELTDLYHFGDLDQISLQTAIYQAQVDAYRAAYLAHAKSSKATLPDNWEPPQAVLDKFEKYAETTAAGIVTTWTDSLARLQAEALGNDSLDELDQLQEQYQTYGNAYADSKSDQVSRTEAGEGADDAAPDFMRAIQLGEVVIDEELAAHLICAILPDDSPKDVCSVWAGMYVPVDQMDGLPEFPLHPNCDHMKHIELDTDF